MYMLNGTIFLVADEPEKFPDLSMITSPGIPIDDGPVDRVKHAPTDSDMRVISTKMAKNFFGDSADVMGGVTVSEDDVKLICLFR
jgi:hypothetical protein